MLGLGLSIPQLAGRGRGGPAFDPVSLFAAGEKGFILKPAALVDFQNSNGTTAAVDNDPVGYAFDHSPNVAHATQATAGNRPLLQDKGGGKYAYEFDGTNDFLTTPAVDLSGTSKATIVMALTVRTSAGNNAFLATTTLPSTGNPGGVEIGINVTNNGLKAVVSGGTAASTNTTGTGDNDLYVFPQTAVLRYPIDVTVTGNGEMRILWNGDDVTGVFGAETGAAALSSQIFNIGSRSGGSRPASIDLYGMVLIGRETTPAENTALDAWAASQIAWPIADNFDVILVAGDSNAAGSGQTLSAITDVSASYQLGQAETAHGNGNKIIDADDPLEHVGALADRIGFATAFAREYEIAYPSRKLLLVPAARGGQGFSDDSWNEGDPAYVIFITRIERAMATRFGNQLKGVLWMGGTNETGFYTDPVMTGAEYAVALDAFIAAVRADVGLPGLTFVVGPMVPTWAVTEAGYQDIQDAIADTPNRVANVAYVDPEGLTLTENSGLDPWHFSADAQRTLGPEFFEAYESI